MTGRIPPDGLDPLSAAADGYYVVQKTGKRFREWFRLSFGTGLTVTPGDHQLDVTATPLTPLVTVVGGVPGLVFDADGQIVYTEVP